MSWDFNYQADGVALSTYASSVRLAETSAGRRGDNFTSPFVDGSVWRPKRTRQGLAVLDTVVRYDGPTPHGQGAPGHIFHNLWALKGLLLRDDSTVRIRRTAPNQANVFIDVEVLDPIETGGVRHRFLWPLTVPFPYWQANSGTTATKTGITTASTTIGVTVGGDARAWPTIRVAPGDHPLVGIKIEDPVANQWVEYVGTVPTGEELVINCLARTARLAGGPYVDAALRKRTALWLPLRTGAYNLNLTTTAGSIDYDIEIFHRTTWRL